MPPRETSARNPHEEEVVSPVSRRMASPPLKPAVSSKAYQREPTCADSKVRLVRTVVVRSLEVSASRQATTGLG